MATLSKLSIPMRGKRTTPFSIKPIISQTIENNTTSSPGRDEILQTAEYARAGCWMFSTVFLAVLCCFFIWMMWSALVETVSAIYIVSTDCEDAQIIHFEASTLSNPNVLYLPGGTAYWEPQEWMQIKLHVFPQECAPKSNWRYGETTLFGEEIVISSTDLEKIEKICVVGIGSSEKLTCLNVASK